MSKKALKTTKEQLASEFYAVLIYLLKPIQTPVGRRVVYGTIIGIIISIIILLFINPRAIISTSIISGSGIISGAIHAAIKRKGTG